MEVQDNIELPDDDETVVIEDDLDQELIEEPGEEFTEESDNNEEDQPKKEYSDKVQKRINKIVAQRNVAQNENSQLRARNAELESQHEASKESDLNDRVADIKRRKSELMDEGEFQEAESLNDELLDLKIEQKTTKKPQQQAEQPHKAPTPEAQQQWMNGNSWYGGSDAKSKNVNNIYDELVSEGYDPDDPDTYIELDSRLGNATQKKPKPPAQLAPDRGSVAGNSRQVKFTQKDSSTMREYGLNPNDPAQRKEWLNNKRG